MSTSADTGAYEVVRLTPARTRRRLSFLDEEAQARARAQVAQRQVLEQLGVLRQGSPPPDVSWRQVARRLLFFTVALALLLFGGGRVSHHQAGPPAIGGR